MSDKNVFDKLSIPFDIVGLGIHLFHDIDCDILLKLLYKNYTPKDINEKSNKLNFELYEDIILEDINIHDENKKIKNENNKIMIEFKNDQMYSISEFLSNPRNILLFEMYFSKAVTIYNKSLNFFEITNDDFKKLPAIESIVEEDIKLDNDEIIPKGSRLNEFFKLKIGFEHKCAYMISLCQVSQWEYSLSFNDEELQFLIDKRRYLIDNERLDKKYLISLTANCCY